MKIAIRVDASMKIGSGHLMRCMCLADELHVQGASVRFVSRQLPEYLRNLIAERQHEFVALPAWDEEGALAADFQQRDAEETLMALSDSADFEWLIVDHYSLGETWESTMRQAATRLMAIDDLGRQHDCDLLLDQNFYFDAHLRYADGVPAACISLLGPRYALLRPEFQKARQDVTVRDGDVRRVMVFLGGMDADNVTERVIKALASIDLGGADVDVVIGQAHPARQKIEALCAAMRRVRCHVQTEEMAKLLAQTDLAIGAGGSATWERCSLGVPTLALCLAANQQAVLREGSRKGFVYSPDDAVISESALVTHLRALLANRGLRNLLSRTAMELVDGQGARRVAAALWSREISMRRVSAKDSAAIHCWRNHPDVRSVSRNPQELSFEEHQRWFEATLRSSDRHLLIGERDGAPVGVVRFDVDAHSAEVSIYLVPGQGGRGEGSELLTAAENWLKAEYPETISVLAEVLASNLASQRLFERCGYQKMSKRYSKRLHA